MNQFEALNKLSELESQGVKGSYVTNDGIFRYNNNMPTFEDSAEYKKEGLYVVQRMGDILLSVRILGNYTYAKIFQYDFGGSNKIVYWEGQTDEPIAPFKDGIALLPVGKSIYIEVENGEHTNVICQYAVLDKESRKESFNSYSENGGHGVKLEHTNGELYQAYNICDIGYSPNVLAPVV